MAVSCVMSSKWSVFNGERPLLPWISHSCYEQLVQHYKHAGLSSEIHGNKGRSPLNTLHFEVVYYVTEEATVSG